MVADRHSIGCVYRLREYLPLAQCAFVTAHLGHVFGVGWIWNAPRSSVRVCPEYFTIGHPPIKGLTNPTLLGITWGFLGGFPGGIVLGIPLSLSMNLGGAPRFPLRDLRRPLVLLVLGVAFGTRVSGMSGWYNAQVVDITIGEPWHSSIPRINHRRFFIVASAHFGTYLSASILGIGLSILIIYQRIKAHG